MAPLEKQRLGRPFRSGVRCQADLARPDQAPCLFWELPGRPFGLVPGEGASPARSRFMVDPGQGGSGVLLLVMIHVRSMRSSSLGMNPGPPPLWGRRGRLPHNGLGPMQSPASGLARGSGDPQASGAVRRLGTSLKTRSPSSGTPRPPTRLSAPRPRCVERCEPEASAALARVRRRMHSRRAAAGRGEAPGLPLWWGHVLLRPPEHSAAVRHAVPVPWGPWAARHRGPRGRGVRRPPQLGPSLGERVGVGC